MNPTRREFLAASAATLGVWTPHPFTLTGASAAQAPLVPQPDAAPDTALKRAPTSPFLAENFGPVREEIIADRLQVKGKLPPDLDGMFVRNGPNPQFPPRQNYHWFDGDGMVHAVRIRDGQASYQNRWVRTQAWTEEHEAGRAIFPSILDVPEIEFVVGRLLAGKFPYPNRANTALVWHHGKLLALWEGGMPHEVSLTDLATIGPYKFGGQLQHAFTAHPKVDPRTGEMIFFGYSPFPPYLRHGVADRQGRIVHTTAIDLPRSVMIHDMAVTQNYTVFFDVPATITPAAIMRGEPLLSWQPKFGARVGILPRYADGSKITWFDIETCFVFHVFNAYEKDDVVTLHACRFPEYPKFVDMTPGTVTRDNFEQLGNAMNPVTYRWDFDLMTGETREVALDDRTTEFPRIDERRTGAAARYGYAVTGKWNTSRYIKYDLKTGRAEEHSLGKSVAAGEGVFVPRQDSSAEDDGYLISFVHDREEQRSELSVIDCRQFTGPPLARVSLPQRVPYGFHGLWVPEREFAG